MISQYIIQNSKVKKYELNTISILIFLYLMFGYNLILGIRIIVVLSLFLLLYCLLKNIRISSIKVNKSPSFLVSIFILMYTTVLAIYSENYKSIGSTLIFFLLAYWPIFGGSLNTNNAYKKISFTYLLAAIITSIGVILQMLVYKLTNTHLGLIQQFGGERIAYGFIWNDYSFLSLFLVSAVPFTLSLKKVQYKYILTLILISGSLITSARTGIASLILAYSIYIILRVPFLIKKKKTYRYILLSILLLVIIYILQDNFRLMNRSFSFGGSGREKGYLEAIEYFSHNILFGAYLNIDTYSQLVGTIPHNLFIYSASLGGLIYLILILIWLIFLSIECFNTRNINLKLSFLIIIIGFQFIPSFFSAYFFAVLISIITLYNQNKNYENPIPNHRPRTRWSRKSSC